MQLKQIDHNHYFKSENKLNKWFKGGKNENMSKRQTWLLIHAFLFHATWHIPQTKI